MKYSDSVVVRSFLKNLLEEESKKLDGCAVEQISKHAIKLFQDVMDKMAAEVAEEAVKGNYFRLGVIDVQRGYDKWLKKQFSKEMSFRLV